MVGPHEPRNVVHAPIAAAALADFSDVDVIIRDRLDEANELLGHPVAHSTLRLIKRAACVLAYHMDRGENLTVQALQKRVAPAMRTQPERGGVPKVGLGNDTVRKLLSPDVADVVELATRLGWTRGDFQTPTALTVFAMFAEAGKDSHALAVANRAVPLMGKGTGSIDSFVIHQLVELVHGTHHDPAAKDCDGKSLQELVALWGYNAIEDMPLLDFDKTFTTLIAEEARQREAFARHATADDVDRTFPRDVVVQRLPHGPYDRRLGTPAGEIMSREHPMMATAIAQHGYRGVLASHEELRQTSRVKDEIGRVTQLERLQIRPMQPHEVKESEGARAVNVDFENVDHYAVTGRDKSDDVQRRVVRHAKYDSRLTVFETVGFSDETMHDAVVLAEYATTSSLRKSCVDASVHSRMKPGLIGANHPKIRAGWRRLAALSNAATIAAKRRAQADENQSDPRAGRSD